jgi:hypothetical protein
MAGVEERRAVLRYSEFSGCPVDKCNKKMKTQGGNFKTVAEECSCLYNRRIFDKCKPRNQLKIINKP